MSETALATRQEFEISVDDVRKYFAPTATEKEFALLVGICKSYGLNPYKREVHFVKYGSAPASIITGYEIYLKRAERTGKLDGWKCWIEKDGIGEKAVIEIKRKDQSIPIRWEVYRSEFDKGQSTWKSMPSFMLKKVAIAQGFRLAFPDDLGGMPYIPEEMPHDKGGGTSEALPKEGEVINAVVEEPSKTAPPAPPVETPKVTTTPAPQDDAAMYSTAYVLKVERKDGESSSGKKWTRWAIVDGDGTRYGTFDQKVADTAQDALDNNAPVSIAYIQEPRGKRVVNLQIAEGGGDVEG